MLTIFLDIETTGLDPRQHHPIDIALVVIDHETGEQKGSYQQLIKLSEQEWAAHDPVSIEINGYTYGDIKKGMTIDQVSSEIVDLFTELNVERGKAVFICQNPAFDRAFFGYIVPVYTQEVLNWPYHWLDLASMYWVLFNKELNTSKQTFPELINLSKNTIGKQFGITPEAEPHRAMNGVTHLIECYRAVFDRICF